MRLRSSPFTARDFGCLYSGRRRVCLRRNPTRRLSVDEKVIDRLSLASLTVAQCVCQYHIRTRSVDYILAGAEELWRNSIKSGWYNIFILLLFIYFALQRKKTAVPGRHGKWYQIKLLVVKVDTSALLNLDSRNIKRTERRWVQRLNLAVGVAFGFCAAWQRWQVSHHADSVSYPLYHSSIRCGMLLRPLRDDLIMRRRVDLTLFRGSNPVALPNELLVVIKKRLRLR